MASSRWSRCEDQLLARLPEYRQHLWACQEAQHRPLEALHRNGQRPLDVVQRSDVTPSSELQERAQRREPQVATANRVLAALLQMVEECQDQFGPHVGKLHGRRRLAQLVAGEAQNNDSASR
jgi:hypothetical protein